MSILVKYQEAWKDIRKCPYLSCTQMNVICLFWISLFSTTGCTKTSNILLSKPTRQKFSLHDTLPWLLIIQSTTIHSLPWKKELEDTHLTRTKNKKCPKQGAWAWPPQVLLAFHYPPDNKRNIKVTALKRLVTVFQPQYTGKCFHYKNYAADWTKCFNSVHRSLDDLWSNCPKREAAKLQ